MLANLIRVQPNTQNEQGPEDIFSSSLSNLFPDDTQLLHGDSSSVVVYKSAFGDLEFRCADVTGQEDQSKFAHYLWNSGILMGELIGRRPELAREFTDPTRSWWLSRDEEAIWSANGHRVIELGAGA
jgi:EEF1A N-terminal glycine/lysine methyltransferase